MLRIRKETKSMSFILIDPSLNRERERAVTTFDGLEKNASSLSGQRSGSSGKATS